MQKNKFIENLENFLETWSRTTELFEKSLVTNISASVPWIAPLIPAYLAFDNMLNVLLFPKFFAIIGACTIEFLGISTITTTVQFFSWNKNKLKTEQESPFLLSLVNTIYYFAIVILINVILDEQIYIYKIAKALLSTMSISSAIILTLRSQHTKRISVSEKEKEERKEARKRKVPESFQENNGKNGKVSGNIASWKNLSEENKIKMKEIPASEIAEKFGVSERTARNWRKSSWNL